MKTFFRIAGTTFFDFEMRGGLGRVEIALNEIDGYQGDKTKRTHALLACVIPILPLAMFF